MTTYSTEEQQAMDSGNMARKDESRLAWITAAKAALAYVENLNEDTPVDMNLQGMYWPRVLHRGNARAAALLDSPTRKAGKK